jgi:hypothetical protein
LLTLLINLHNNLLLIKLRLLDFLQILEYHLLIIFLKHNIHHPWLDPIHHSQYLILPKKYRTLSNLRLNFASDLLFAHSEQKVYQAIHGVVYFFDRVFWGEVDLPVV